MWGQLAAAGGSHTRLGWTKRGRRLRWSPQAWGWRSVAGWLDPSLGAWRLPWARAGAAARRRRRRRCLPAASRLLSQAQTQTGGRRCCAPARAALTTGLDPWAGAGTAGAAVPPHCGRLGCWQTAAAAEGAAAVPAGQLGSSAGAQRAKHTRHPLALPKLTGEASRHGLLPWCAAPRRAHSLPAHWRHRPGLQQRCRCRCARQPRSEAPRPRCWPLRWVRCCPSGLCCQSWPARQLPAVALPAHQSRQVALCCRAPNSLGACPCCAAVTSGGHPRGTGRPVAGTAVPAAAAADAVLKVCRAVRRAPEFGPDRRGRAEAPPREGAPSAQAAASQPPARPVHAATMSAGAPAAAALVSAVAARPRQSGLGIQRHRGGQAMRELRLQGAWMSCRPAQSCHADCGRDPTCCNHPS